MSRVAVSALTIVCFVGLCAQFAAAQGPIRKIVNEAQLQRADYPGPIAYAPSDQDTRSKRLRLQTGHYGWFYNCDNEECKRSSPYICWNSQHKADWYCGWKTALRRDRNDVIQRLFDGSCNTCDCQDCADGQVHGSIAPQYGEAPNANSTNAKQSLVAQVEKAKSANQQKATIGGARPVINSGLLGNRKPQTQNQDVAPQREAKRKGLFRFR